MKKKKEKMSIMDVVYLMLSAVFLGLNNIGAKLQKSEGIGNFLNLVIAEGVASILSWGMVLAFQERVTKDMLVYALFMAIFMVSATIAMYRAFDCGPVAGTALCSEGSLVIVVIYGYLFCHESPRMISIVGMVLIVMALILLSTNEEKTVDAQNSTKKVSFSWMVLGAIVLITNSLISITGKIRQTQVGGKYPFAFIALSLTLACLLNLVAYLALSLKKTSIKRDITNAKESFVSLLCEGCGMAGANLVICYLSTRMDGAILYPVSFGVGFLLTSLYGFIILKEKATKKSIFGLVTGLIAIVLLNI